jgi:hypothetical protein
MKTKNILICFICTVLCLFSFAGNSAAIELFDGKLQLEGRYRNQVKMRAKGQEPEVAHDYDFFNARTSLKLEALYRAYDGPDYRLNVYSVWKNFYDAAADWDSGYNNNLHEYNIGHRADQPARYYDSFRNISRELYVELTSDLFQIRLGKQIVAWGETDVQRMVDMVNPVDENGALSGPNPDWAELKRGLWMLRFFFTPENMPADMTFEFLVIPGYETNLAPPFGSNMTLNHGLLGFPYNAPGEIPLSYERDSPGNWKTPELGMRIRGFTYSVDWTISYLYHRTRGQPLMKEYDFTGDPAGFAGYMFSKPFVTGVGRYHNDNDFPWQSTFGVTFNIPVETKIPIIPGTGLAFSGSVLRFEGIYEMDKENINTGDGLSNKHVENDRIAGVLAWSSKIYIPGVTPWARQEHLNSTTQFFCEWIPGKKRNDAIFPFVTYAPNKHHYAEITQTFWMEFWHGKITPGVYFSHKLQQGGGFIAPSLMINPRNSWLITFSYTDYHDYNPSYDEKDYWFMEVSYDF